MKKCMKGTVYLLSIIMLFTHYPFYTNGYNRRLVNDKLNWRSRRQEQIQNVGTVLFDRNDIAKECWSNDELILLNSRIIFNDILPQANLINGKNDKFIDMFMDYVDICLEVVEKLTAGKTKHLVMKALADTMGGYLRVYILPITKSSYYAGNIKYQKAKRVYDLYDDLKTFLRTNGVDWLTPIISANHFNASPLSIPHYNRSRRTRTSCSNLILYSDNGGGDENLVPIPFLDDDKRPNSIALPYENESLWSLFSAKSAFILVKYYTDVMHCMPLLSVDKNQLNNFKRELNDWLYRDVKPLLNDEKWYPAFGGVLRVMASLEASDVVSGSQLLDVGYHATPEYHVKSKTASDSLFNQFFSPPFDLIEIITIALSIIVLIYLLIGICINWWIACSKERRKIEAFKQTPILDFYRKPTRSKYTRSARSSRYKCKLSNDCTSSDEEKYLNELTYSNTSAISPVMKKKCVKSPSAPALPCHISPEQPYYTSDETSAFSSSIVKETSS